MTFTSIKQRDPPNGNATSFEQRSKHLSSRCGVAEKYL